MQQDQFAEHSTKRLRVRTPAQNCDTSDVMWNYWLNSVTSSVWRACKSDNPCRWAPIGRLGKDSGRSTPYKCRNTANKGVQKPKPNHVVSLIHSSTYTILTLQCCQGKYLLFTVYTANNSKCCSRLKKRRRADSCLKKN